MGFLAPEAVSPGAGCLPFGVVQLLKNSRNRIPNREAREKGRGIRKVVSVVGRTSYSYSRVIHWIKPKSPLVFLSATGNREFRFLAAGKDATTA